MIKKRQLVTHLKVQRLITNKSKNHCNPVIAIAVPKITNQVWAFINSLSRNNSVQKEVLHAKVKKMLHNKVINSLDQ